MDAAHDAPGGHGENIRVREAAARLNVLITSASRKVGLVKSFKRALKIEGGGSVIAADANPQSAALYFSDEAVVLPRDDDPAYFQAIFDLCVTRKISLVVPTRDEELPFFAAQKEKFAAMGTVVAVCGPETVLKCQDKALFAEFCLRHGFKIPEIVSDAAAPEFPLFVRPRRGKGGRGAVRVDFQEHLQAILKLMPDAVVQKFDCGDEYTVDLFADFSGRVISVVPRRRISVTGGESFVSRTVKDPALMDESARLAIALGLVGHNTIQCFRDSGGVRFIEVNPRYGGAAALSIEAGADTPRWLLKIVKGETLAPRISDFKDDMTMLRYTEDVFVENSTTPSLSQNMT
jgi:carbamoyl-phosphate synthase large subunit